MAEKILSNTEVIYLIQELKRLEEASKEKRTRLFNKIPAEFKVSVCLGCGKRYEDRDCGCSAGSSERLRSEAEITELLDARLGPLSVGIVSNKDLRYRIAEETRGFEQDMAYPQYKRKYDQQDVISADTWIQLQQYVQDRMNRKTFGGNYEVREHMIKILNGIIPFGMRIAGE